MKHKAVFKGNVKRKSYKVLNHNNHRELFGEDRTWDYGEPKIVSTFLFEGDKEILQCELDSPPLNEDDCIYVNELEKQCYIDKVLRTTSNEFIYYIDHDVEIIEDEQSEIDRINAEEQLQRVLIEYNEYIANKKSKQKKKWYQFWK